MLPNAIKVKTNVIKSIKRNGTLLTAVYSRQRKHCIKA